MSNVLVITRHTALVQYLIKKGFVQPDVQVVEHATAEAVAGKHVWGVLPHHLSSLTASFTEIQLTLPTDKRGVELTMDDMIQYASEPITYTVRRAVGGDNPFFFDLMSGQTFVIHTLAVLAHHPLLTNNST